ncbi:MAG: hypothetical protein L0210_06015 [Rhodospirillales bacterium]|nr:hypothetical protein [Rhodospirillales bacterium]
MRRTKFTILDAARLEKLFGLARQGGFCEIHKQDILLWTTRYCVGLGMVQFTPGQLRSAASIAPETYRHWKKALAPLRRERGHSPCFTAGDLVAVAVVRALCLDLGIRVSALASIANALFDSCNNSPWAVLERGKFIFDIPRGQVQFQPELATTLAEGALVTVPLRLIVTQLRDQLLTVTKSEDQQALRFPPTPLTPPTSSAMRGRS